MPKFHKKFFRQTEGEDELVIECLRDSGLEKIFKSIESQLDGKVFPQYERGEKIKEINIWRCECPFEEKNVYWRNHPKRCVGAKKTYNGELKWDHISDSCEHFDMSPSVRDPESEDDVIEPKVEKLVGKVFSSHSIKKTRDLIDRKEREILCKASNGFIIGYADLYFSCHYSPRKNIRVEDGSLWKNQLEAFSRDYDVVVEAKPEVKDTAAVLRQVKTYMDNLGERGRTIFGVIATYSDIDPEVVDTLNEENVAVAVFEKNNQKKNSLDDFVDEEGSSDV